MKKYFLIFLFLPSIIFCAISKKDLIKIYDEREKNFQSKIKYLKVEIFTCYKFDEILMFNTTIENFIDSFKINSIMFDSTFKDTLFYSYKFKKDSSTISKISPVREEVILFNENIYRGLNIKYLLPDSFIVKYDNDLITIKNKIKNEPLTYIKIDKNYNLKELAIKTFYDVLSIKIVSYRKLKYNIFLPDSVEIQGLNMDALISTKIKKLDVIYR